mgnify:CR=1 FL=1
MKYNRPFARKQNGATTMEVLFFLIVAALVLYGVVQMGFKLFGKQTNNTEQSNVAELIINTRALKSSQGYGASGTNIVPQLIATDGIPNGLTVVSNVAYNAWNGVVSVASAGVAFTITYQSVPKDACVALATKVAKNQAFSTRINSGTALTGEVTAAIATTSCSGTSNTVAWTVSS